MLKINDPINIQLDSINNVGLLPVSNDKQNKDCNITWWCVLRRVLQFAWISWTWNNALKKSSFKSSPLRAFICTTKHIHYIFLLHSTCMSKISHFGYCKTWLPPHWIVDNLWESMTQYLAVVWLFQAPALVFLLYWWYPQYFLYSYSIL